jgi:alpha-L-rhamnosidase
MAAFYGAEPREGKTMATAASIYDEPERAWSGRWIWQDEAGPINSWMRFRKKLLLATAPKTASARIAVDSKYWLYVNGVMIVREGGVKRGPTPQSTWFDTVDLVPHLRAGDNTIAVLVTYWGKHGFSHKDSGQGGLLFDARIDGQALSSDSSWQVSQHPAFAVAIPDPQPNYRLPEQNVRFDARLDDPIWMETEYDDGGWSPARDKGAAPCAPWGELWPRSIPPWRDAHVRWLTAGGDLPRSADGKYFIGKLPYNLMFTPVIEVEAAAGTLIVLRTDNYCGGGNGTEFNIRTDFICSGKIDTFESPAWMNGHELHIEAPLDTKLRRVGFRETGYDCDLSGSFTCDDAALNTLWSKAQRTLYITMRDTYFDCPDRERAQWWGDVAIELGETFYSLERRADALSRKAILDLVRWQRPDGSLYSPIPDGNWSRELPQQILASISRFGFGTYLLHSGDDSILREVYPALRRYLALWQLDEQGLVIHRAGEWDWCDWGNHFDVALLDNVWYWLALEAAITFARRSGNDGDIAAYEQSMATVAAAVQRHFWTADGFRSPAHQGPIDDRGNGLAVLTGIVQRDQWPKIIAVLLANKHASPYMEKYVLEALFTMNRPDLALARMRERYQPMIDSELSTLWEVWNTGGWGTNNHAWSGGPLTLLSQYVAGIEPTSAGYATFRIAPNPAELRSFALSVPSPRGEITAQYQRGDDRISLDVTVPTGAIATVILPTCYGALRDLRVNGTAPTSSSAAGATQPRERGLQLPAGRWQLSAKVEPLP